MLRNGEGHTDFGADFYVRSDPGRVKNKAIRQLRDLGYNVTVTPAV
ncbi:hypothetical protein [Microbacterium rhizosphaerae]|uniref:Uncharacterized protein n=1 Tax=Microbacterium rhizosphaerae TaxID=1678237 RepID=A0ABZ0SVB6_9MICO|nr:hypothetical protein [Microbacterium rhizosphaerae]WPR91351.1 hypothetical protein SM116_08765 [Microbacterium rhizosphaerae]